jgi:hypothetical protein
MSDHTALTDWCEPVSRTQYRNMEPVPWDIGFVGSGVSVLVPVGTVFDVSIPRGLRWLLSPHDPRFLKAACLHDWLLRINWDRPTAGGVFHAALSAAGVGLWTRMVMFLGVTLWKWK